MSRVILQNTLTELNAWYDIFNKELFNNELEDSCVVTICPRGRKNAYGWFDPNLVWQCGDNEFTEIVICAETLSRSVFDILETLLHEMVHLYNYQNGINDCSKQGKHNDKFKQAAENFGLICCEPDEKLGYYQTKLNDDVREMIENATIDYICLGLHRKEPKQKKAPVKKPMHVYTCKNCGVVFKLSKEFDLVCGTCGNQIEYEEK